MNSFFWGGSVSAFTLKSIKAVRIYLTYVVRERFMTSAFH